MKYRDTVFMQSTCERNSIDSATGRYCYPYFKTKQHCNERFRKELAVVSQAYNFEKRILSLFIKETYTYLAGKPLDRHTKRSRRSDIAHTEHTVFVSIVVEKEPLRSTWTDGGYKTLFIMSLSRIAPRALLCNVILK